MKPLADKADKLLQSKRYKECLKERDELCNDHVSLINDTTILGKGLRTSNKDFSELQEKYQSFSTASGIKLAKLTDDLKIKSDELDKKQKQLQEREQKLTELQRIINKQDSVVYRLNEILSKALIGFNSDELSIQVKNGKVYISMSDKLLFHSGSDEVETKGKIALKQLAEVLNKNTNVDILVEGHTDNVPIKNTQFHDNWDLSTARATSVVRLLVDEYGVAPQKLTASGKSEFYPVAPNEVSGGRARNRRTEIVLSPKLDELFKIIEKR